jgi:hypothetical protein
MYALSAKQQMSITRKLCLYLTSYSTETGPLQVSFVSEGGDDELYKYGS